CRNVTGVQTCALPIWCAKAGYRFNAEKAAAIYSHAGSQVDTLPMSSAIQSLITHAVAQLNMIIETISAIQHEMLTLASQLPEYQIGRASCRETVQMTV